MDNPLIFDIKKYSTNDGPGVRLTIFFKGCPLSCAWCHNPEGVSPRRQKMHAGARCIACLQCAKKCPQGAIKPTASGMSTDMQQCNLCGLCAKVCPSRAMEITGEEYSIQRLVDEVRKETIFMDQSGGGVTVCGGEPLMQPRALWLLLKALTPLDLHIAVDTTLYASPRVLSRILPYVDLFLVDLKMMNNARHICYCGVSNEIILSNIKKLSAVRARYDVRIPLIEGINADDDNIIRTAQFINSLSTRPLALQLLPYHDAARGKHARLGTEYNPNGTPMSAPSAERLARIREIFHSHGIESVTGKSGI